MQIKTVLLTIAAVCSSVAFAGYAQVLNRCSFPVYLWSATPTTTSGGHTLAASTGFYEEAYQSLPSGGVSLKISQYNDIAALYNGSALTQNQYTLNGALVWYSLVDTGGDPFLGNVSRIPIFSCDNGVLMSKTQKITLIPSGAGQSIIWKNGQGPSQIFNTDAANHLTLTLCAQD